jgi:hypothetical protein
MISAARFSFGDEYPREGLLTWCHCVDPGGQPAVDKINTEQLRHSFLYPFSRRRAAEIARPVESVGRPLNSFTGTTRAPGPTGVAFSGTFSTGIAQSVEICVCFDERSFVPDVG